MVGEGRSAALCACEMSTRRLAVCGLGAAVGECGQVGGDRLVAGR